ncbi:class I SAM-dependent RNA methyltransferase [Martelella lutilitoris]|uniref:Class I SAM-dependent RNA methyltransferase n=1 Tax=Martelella lutilitoris TaxID=2583532 RepID=A0A5C4JQT1_9HYPH|nr:class I SAM-dependent RNA methyltransferase [Martelella lutilitoris]TNB47835.1 class I SAM-dependent RNA methyltransferase [Martelella lutilitoris]
MAAETFEIERLGSQGDGIAAHAQGPVFIPFTLPGEKVKVAREKSKAVMLSLLEAAPERIAPACRHFGPDGENGTCGGCSLQHLERSAYDAFKRRVVIDALSAHGIDCPVAPLVTSGPGERRRASFAGRRTENGILLGFSSPESHHIVAIEECPVLSPALLARLPALKLLAGILVSTSDPFRVAVMETETGLDISFAGIKAPSEKRRQAATRAVMTVKGIDRLAIGDEIIVEPVKPELNLSGTRVFPPPASFAQATLGAEAAMTDLVVRHLRGSKRVADLFSGFGTFALRLAAKSRVHAVEFDGPALTALDHAVRNRQGLKQVTTERRDLFRRPLLPRELAPFDGVVFDPPRAGAKEQAEELARSNVARIVAVSCNPQTLGRDLSILGDGGYSIDTVVPVDQFFWSAHVEAVACLSRK